MIPWRNGNASDSSPEDWGFDSLWDHFFFFFFLFDPHPQKNTKKQKKKKKKISTPQRFELWRAEPNRFLIYLLNHSDMVSSTGRLQEILIPRQRVRVVKEVDSKSTGLCPREFKSRRCRSLFFSLHQRVHPASAWYALVMVRTGRRGSMRASPVGYIHTTSSPVV